MTRVKITFDPRQVGPEKIAKHLKFIANWRNLTVVDKTANSIVVEGWERVIELVLFDLKHYFRASEYVVNYIFD